MQGKKDQKQPSQSDKKKNSRSPTPIGEIIEISSDASQHNEQQQVQPFAANYQQQQQNSDHNHPNDQQTNINGNSQLAINGIGKSNKKRKRDQVSGKSDDTSSLEEEKVIQQDGRNGGDQEMNHHEEVIKSLEEGTSSQNGDKNAKRRKLNENPKQEEQIKYMLKLFNEVPIPPRFQSKSKQQQQQLEQQQEQQHQQEQEQQLNAVRYSDRCQTALDCVLRVKEQQRANHVLVDDQMKKYRQQIIQLDERPIENDESLVEFDLDNLSAYDIIPAMEGADDSINCNQMVFVRSQPNGQSKVLWAIYALGEDMLASSKQLISPIFNLQDHSQWYLVLHPRVSPETCQSSLTLIAHPNELEKKPDASMKRRLFFSFYFNNKPLKNWYELEANFTDQDDKFTIEKLYSYKHETQLKLGFDKQILIELNAKPKVYFEEPNVQVGATDAGQSQIVTRSTKRKAAMALQTQFIGLVNEGTTCYINSLLQTLNINRAFRRAIYDMPTNIDSYKSIPFCLQRIFYNLQTGKEAQRTFELLSAFGWNQKEINQQHDVGEFFLCLSDILDNAMKDTQLNATYKNLFEGLTETVIQCVNIDYESSRQEKFNCLTLSMQNVDNIEDAIRKFTAVEDLIGDNQYDAEQLGKQDARKFVRFTKLPPVLQVQINRFAYDPVQNKLNKINSPFKFCDTLDLDSVLSDEANMSQQNVLHSQIEEEHHSQNQQQNIRNLYHLHSILVHRGSLGAGHYFAFIRPGLEDNWFEFNDELVTPMIKQTALAIGSGGPESFFEHKDGRITEKTKANDTSAYMLVYFRDMERQSILRDIPIKDIPPHLKEFFDEENRLNHKLENDQSLLENCGTVNIVSLDILKLWQEGAGFMQIPDDIYFGDRFYDNKQQHLTMKMNKKQRVIDLLTQIRKKVKQPLTDLNLYRLKYNRIPSGLYSFQLIEKDNYNSDIFPRKQKNQKSHAIFYLCNNKEPTKPILAQYSKEEQAIRLKKYQQLIDFVKRRDLNPDFIKTYKDKIKEQWKFVNQDNSAEEISIIDVDASDQQLQLNSGDEERKTSSDNLMVNNNEGTMDIPLQCIEPDDNVLETLQMDELKMQSLAVVIEIAKSQDDALIEEQKKRLLFIKHYQPKLEKENLRLQIVSQILLPCKLTFIQVKKRILQHLMLEQNEEEKTKIKYQFFLEAPCKTYDIGLGKIFDQQNGVHPLTDAVEFHSLEDVDNGSIIIVTVDTPNIGDEIGLLIEQKNSEIWVELLGKSGDSTQFYQYGKHLMSYLHTVEEVYEEIKKAVELSDGKQIEDGHIQLIIENDRRVEWDQKNLEFQQLIVNNNEIHFEILPFHIKDLPGKLIVKILHYTLQNEEGQLYTELADLKINIWRLVKFMQEERLNKVDGEQYSSKNYVVCQIDSYSKIIQRVVNYKELFQQVDQQAQKSDSMLRINCINDVEVWQLSNFDVGLLFCFCCDQYTRTLGNPFLVIISQNAEVKDIREAILAKLLQHKITYNSNRSGSGKDSKELLKEVTDEEKENFIISYVEFKQSRRQICYDSYTLKELSKEKKYLDFKKGENYLNMACEFMITYQEDENHKSGNQLKILQQ